MYYLLQFHSGLRWLIVLLALILIVWTTLVWLRRDNGDTLTPRLAAGLNALLGIQFLLGLIYLLGTGFTGAGFPMHRIEHAVIMLIAVGLVGVTTRWKAQPAPLRARNTLLLVLTALLLIYIGVARLPQGWLG